ncbi:MAG TPA: CocE/NonD family hydrolase [Gaiellaceae bacterium]|nr:CocE/NonD family hydrolase [Gaiellaceae bacterium]
MAGSIDVQDVAVPLPDGTRLATDLFLPADGERHPVFLLRTPYSRASLRAVHDPVELARAGWAVVVQDVRGRVASEGRFDALRQEGPDGAAVVEWCAAQPWSTGRVAMAGASYNGWVQWTAARHRPRGLAAIAPLVSSPYAGRSWFREGGAFKIGAWANWAMAMATAGNGGTRAAERRAVKDVQRLLELVAHPPDVERIASHFPAFAEWYAADVADWAETEGPGPLASRVQVPVYNLTGWYDIFVEGAIDAYEELAHRSRREAVRRSQRLVVGPWSHMADLIQVVGTVDFGAEANWLQRGIPAEQLRFLRDAAEGREVRGGVDVFVMGRNRWLELDSWPPPATETAFHLESGSSANGSGGDGRLLDAPPERAGFDRWRHDPADPVPTTGGRHLLWQPAPPGPADQREVERRRDVLVYTSEPLARELTAIGRVRAELHVASTAPRADFAVKLVDVHPDGRAINVVDSISRADLVPGRTTRVSVDVGRTAMTFLRGHRLRIEVASSNHPHLDLLEAADQTLHWGGRTPSRLLLPLHGG